MPLPIMLAHKLTRRLAEVRRAGDAADFLRPDGKSQVTVEYEDGKPVRVDAVVISTQHADDVSNETLAREVIEARHQAGASRRTCSTPSTKYHINPTGRFVIGGPQGDTGLTGRKIIVDTYGGMGRHGGGAFSGKDPSKVDRSACYMARYIAKNIVAAGLADACEVQLAYAIGVAEPVSVHGRHVRHRRRSPTSKLVELVRDALPADARGHHRAPRPAPADLPQPRPPTATSAAPSTDFTWERTDKAEAAAGRCARRKRRSQRIRSDIGTRSAITTIAATSRTSRWPTRASAASSGPTRACRCCASSASASARRSRSTGMRIAACLHVTTETANLMRHAAGRRRRGGAVRLQPAVHPGRRRGGAGRATTASRPSPSRARTTTPTTAHLRRARPQAARSPWTTAPTWSSMLHTEAQRPARPDVIGGTEETTTGVIRLRAMAAGRRARATRSSPSTTPRPSTCSTTATAPASRTHRRHHPRHQPAARRA